MKKRYLAGFTLIEVLVTVFVLAVGIMGIASTQALGVRESQNTYYRTQADMLARDIVDRMRANRDAAQDTTSSVYAFKTGDSLGTVPACDSSVANCTAAQMAIFDLSAWQTAVTNSGLPSPSVSVVRASPTSFTYTVQVLWDEDRDGTVGTACNTSQACTRLVIEI